MIEKITNIGDGFKHKLNKVFIHKCRIYIAKGCFEESETPTTKSDLKELYTGETAKFLPFGDLDGGGSRITSTDKTYKIDFGTISLGVEVTGKFVLLTWTPEMVEFVADKGTQEYTLLCVPEDNNSVFLALNGVCLTCETDLSIVDEAVTKITIKATKEADKLTNIIKYKELTT